MNRPANSLMGVSLVLAAVAAVGCGDKITNITYVIAPDGATGGQPPGTPGSTADGSTSETAGDGAAVDGSVAGGDGASVTPPPPPTDSGAPAAPYAGKPWNGMPQMVPGTLQFEFYDLGGEGIAYHDNDAANQGNGVVNLGINKPEAMFRRMEGVDLSYTKPPADRYVPGGMVVPADQLYVGWTHPGEWMKYTINVAETGNYMLSMLTAANNDGSTISFTFEDGTGTGPLPVPRSGAYTLWAHLDNMAIVKLAAGQHVMTVKFEAVANANLDYLIFTRKP